MLCWEYFLTAAAENEKADRGAPSAAFSVSVLWLASFAAAAAALLTQVLLTKAYAPSDYGLYAASLTAASLLAPLAGFGLPGFLLKAFGSEGEAANRCVATGTRVLAVTLPLAMLLCGLYAAGVRSFSDERLIGVALSPVVLAFVGVELITAKHQIEHRPAVQSLWIVAPNAFRLTVAVVCWSLDLQVQWAAVGIGGGSLFIGLYSIFLVRRNRWISRDPQVQVHVSQVDSESEIRQMIRGSIPFGLGQTIFLAYSQGQTLLLEAFRGAEAAGAFSLALSALAAVYLIPSVVLQRFLWNRFHRWAVHDPDRMLRVYQVVCGRLLLSGAALGLAVALFAPRIIASVLGEAYAEVGWVLVMCSLCVPARFLSTNFGVVLMTGENARHRIRTQLCVAATTIIGAVFLVERFGVVGAAAALTTGEYLLALAYLWACGKYLFGTKAWSGWSLSFKQAKNSRG